MQDSDYNDSLPSHENIQLSQFNRCICDREVMNVEGIAPLFVCIGHLCVHRGFGIVEYLAKDELLGTLFINQCLRSIYATERKIFPRHSRPLAIISTEKSTKLIYANITVFNKNTKPLNDAVSQEPHSCRAARQNINICMHAGGYIITLSRNWSVLH